MSTSTVSVNIDSKEQLHISTVKRSKWLIPFRAIGNPSMKNQQCIDALGVIVAFDKSELFLLGIIKDSLTLDHEVVITKKNYSSSEQQKVSKAIATYIKKGLLKRIKREHYMVNPYFLVPKLDLQSALVLRWDSL